MQIEKIIIELTNSDRLPIDALTAASAIRHVAVPVFLREIERYLASDAGTRNRPTPLFFIFHLLGSWREKSAYRPLARLLRQPSEELEEILGDAITVTSHRVMAAVFDRDPTPLYDIILDPAADEFVRSRMCEALAMVTLQGELVRPEAGRFLREAFNVIDPKCNTVWFGWLNAIAMLGLDEMKPLVRQAFDRNSVDGKLSTYRQFEDDFGRAIKASRETSSGETPKPRQFGEGRQQEINRPGSDFELFGDTIDELSKWHRFAAR